MDIQPNDRSESGTNFLQEGSIVVGEVSALTDFGAFVEVGGISGLIPMSELSWAEIQHPQDAVKVGDKVQVQILTIDSKHHRTALSLKQTPAARWAYFAGQYHEGDEVQAIITKQMPFGAFARTLQGEVDGLLRITEGASLVTEGEQVTLTITHIDRNYQRLSFSFFPNPT